MKTTRPRRRWMTPKTEMIRLRVTKAERDALTARAGELSFSLSDYIRGCVPELSQANLEKTSESC